MLACLASWRFGQDETAPSEGACLHWQRHPLAVPFQDEHANGARLPMQGGKYGPACCAVQRKVVDLNQLISHLNSFNGSLSIFFGNAGNEVSFLGIPCFQCHSHLIEIMRIKVALPLPICHVPRKINHHPKTLQHVAAQPANDRFGSLLRIPIKEVSLNLALSWCRRKWRYFGGNPERSNLIQM